MKRRLDLALALLHRPSILFLDEPTTGLDPQSRNALWVEVARLAREDRVTVFLTTQYLEEADVLADRVGIIDAGRIVAEGTPSELKAEIGRPTVQVAPADPDRAGSDHEDARPLRLAGRSGARTSRGAPRRWATTSPTSFAHSTRTSLKVAHLELDEPSLDDVFLAKTGHRLEGQAEAQPEPVGA